MKEVWKLQYFVNGDWETFGTQETEELAKIEIMKHYREHSEYQHRCLKSDRDSKLLDLINSRIKG